MLLPARDQIELHSHLLLPGPTSYNPSKQVYLQYVAYFCFCHNRPALIHQLVKSYIMVHISYINYLSYHIKFVFKLLSQISTLSLTLCQSLLYKKYQGYFPSIDIFAEEWCSQISILLTKIPYFGFIGFEILFTFIS